METIERIKALSDAFGPSGFEDDVAAIVRNELEGYETFTDHMTNVRCEKEPGSDKPNVMLDAHMDETGVIIQAIKPNGTMRFLPLGGWNALSFPTSSFIIRGRKGKDIPGVVATTPPHFMSKAARGNMPEVSDMVIDVGALSKEEAEELGIGIGCPGVPDVKCRYDEERGLFYGKAFDDRIGVACAIEVLKRLQDEEIPCNVQGSFSVQEEVGERGVRANAEALKPDVMIAFEGCPADDTFSEPYMIQAGLGKGPMLRHMDVSMITNWRFQKLALDVAKEKGIPVQESVRSGGGTNGAMVNQMYGVPAIVIGVPVRYIHSSNCYCRLDDYENAVKLGVELCRILDSSAVSKL